MIGGIAKTIRSTLLWRINTGISRRAVRAISPGKLPSYIVVTPHLIHLAPLATLNAGPRVQPVFVSNGLDEADIGWLRQECPDIPLIGLRASLGGNPDSILAHGAVIDYLAETNAAVFSVQDADCFISDPQFWDSVTLDLATEYAACAFVRKGKGDRPDFPETFLTLLNAPLLRKYRQAYGITSETITSPNPKAHGILTEAGYPPGRVLETMKDYYDTLQQYWVVASHQGYRFRRLEGEGQTVHHIGGTSYLYRSFENLEHWDYWPLAVHYINLRVLEMPAASQFRSRFAKLFETHGSADELLRNVPEFAVGRRRKEADAILRRLDAQQLYSKAFA